eukprot:5934511-Pyramimonas_sp.AAC.1
MGLGFSLIRGDVPQSATSPRAPRRKGRTRCAITSAASRAPTSPPRGGHPSCPGPPPPRRGH